MIIQTLIFVTMVFGLFSLLVISIDSSLVVGTLSILVTVLIGWNIYSLVSLERRLKEIKREMMNMMNQKATKVASEAAGLTLLQSAGGLICSEHPNYNEIIRSTFNAAALLNGSIESKNISDTKNECERILKFAVDRCKESIRLDSQEELDIFLKQVQLVHDYDIKVKLLTLCSNNITTNKTCLR